MNDKGLNYQRALLFSELADLVINNFKTLHKKVLAKVFIQRFLTFKRLRKKKQIVNFNEFRDCWGRRHFWKHLKNPVHLRNVNLDILLTFVTYNYKVRNTQYCSYFENQSQPIKNQQEKKVKKGKE